MLVMTGAGGRPDQLGAKNSPEVLCGQQGCKYLNPQVLTARLNTSRYLDLGTGARNQTYTLIWDIGILTSTLIARSNTSTLPFALFNFILPRIF